MGINNGIYTPLTLDDALEEVIDSAPESIVFSPGNPPELILANMFAQANVLIDQNNGSILAMMMSPVGSMIDMMNPNNPRKVDIAATGYIVVTNPTGSPIVIAPNTVITSSTGQTYISGSTSITVLAGGTSDVYVTAETAGVVGNIAAGMSFTISGNSDLTGINPLPLLSGSDKESDAMYLNRLISEKTEYGTQNGSIAVETELKKYYPDARIYINNTVNALTDPIPVPSNGYNLVVRTPSGIMASAAEMAKIFQTEASRLEFSNGQTVGSDLHLIRSGTIYSNGVPQNYSFTPAQPVDITLDIVINIHASSNIDRSETISQANDFAISFLNRLMSFMSGINGTTNITFEDDVEADVVTAVDILGSSGVHGALAPSFGIATIQGLVNDLTSMGNTPQITYESVSTLTITIDPQVEDEAPVVLDPDGAVQFIDFENDVLFSDSTSWYDRYAFIDPSQVTVKMKVTEWI
jgi:hypothetical protein